MSRNVGDFIFPANFEVTKVEPLDGRQLVGTKADLTGTTTWNQSGGMWLYNGAIVAVGSDPTPSNNGIYLLTDAVNYTDINSWEKSGTGSGGGIFSGATNGLTDYSGYVGLGGLLTGDTTICGAQTLNLGNSVSGLTALCAVTPTFYVGDANDYSSINFLHSSTVPHYDVCLSGNSSGVSAGMSLDVNLTNGCFDIHTDPNSICGSGLVLQTTDDNVASFNVHSRNDNFIYTKEACISTGSTNVIESISDDNNTALNIKTVMDYSDRSISFIKDDSTTLSILSGGTARYGSNVTLTNDCDLVHKYYVDNAAGSISANNGLERQGNNVVLGGALTGDTIVSGNTTGSLGLSQVNVADSGCIKFNGTGIIDIKTYSGTSFSGSETGIQIGKEAVKMYANNPIGLQEIKIEDTCMLVTDSGNVQGLVYSGDYEANFVDRSLVTCQYVCSQISGITGAFTTANNGLCSNGQTISLGGSLTGDTTIAGASKNLILNDVGNFTVIGTGATICGNSNLLLRSPSLVIHDGVNEVINISSTCNKLIDSTNNEGFVYADDYSVSGSTNLRWIPDNQYVTGLVSTSITGATNGLNKVGKDAKLGGTLSETTTVCLGGATPYNFLIKNSGATDCTVAEFASTGINLCSQNPIAPNQLSKITSAHGKTIISNGFTNCYSCLTFDDSIIAMSICGGANNACFVVTDATTNKRGIEYAGDYSATFNNNSLVTKLYVSGVTSGITGAFTSANNGLTADGQNVRLGGDLTGDTTISGAHSLELSGLTAFNASATNIGLTGDTTISGNTILDGTLNVSGVTTLLTVNNGTGTDSLLVRDINGVIKQVAPSTLNVTANNGLEAVDNNVTLGGTLTGDTTISGAHSLEFSGLTSLITSASNIDLTGTIGVTGDVGITNNLDVSGITTLNSALDVIGAVELTSTLDVSGATTLHNNLIVSGATTLGSVGSGSGTDSILVIDNDGFIKEVIPSTYETTANNGLEAIDNNVTLGGALTGDTTISGAHNLELSGLTSFSTIATNIDLTGTVGVTGDVGIINNLDVSGNTVLGNHLTVSGITTLGTVNSGTAASPILVIDNGIVKQVAGTAYNVAADNGLTVTDNYVELGGTLTGDTTISGDSKSLILGVSGSSLTNFCVCSTNNIINESATINSTATLSNTIKGGDTCIVLDANYVTLYDNSTTKSGLKYGTCISTGFTSSCSVVDKGYVDDAMCETSNVIDVCIIDSAYTSLRYDDLLAVSGITTSEIALYATPVVGQRLTVVDICGNALADPIIVYGNGILINNSECSAINTDYGSVTYVYNGMFWSATAFIN